MVLIAQRASACDYSAKLLVYASNESNLWLGIVVSLW